MKDFNLTMIATPDRINDGVDLRFSLSVSDLTWEEVQSIGDLLVPKSEPKGHTEFISQGYKAADMYHSISVVNPVKGAYMMPKSQRDKT